MTVSRFMLMEADTLFAAFTSGLGRWFASPGSLLLRAEVNAPFFFETAHRFEGETAPVRQAHYGRFLALEPGRLIRMTWVTGPEGTRGAETVLTVTLASLGETTALELTQEGFADQESAEQHEKAWPFVLVQLESAGLRAETEDSAE